MSHWQEQAPPSPRRLKHFIVALVLIAVGGLGIFWAGKAFFDRSYQNEPVRLEFWFRSAAVLIYGVMLFYLAIWNFAGDRVDRWQSHPQYLDMAIRNLARMPAIMCGVLLVFTPLWWWVMVHYEYRLAWELSDRLLQVVLGVQAVGLVAMCVAGWGFNRLVRPRFLANVRERHICYQCSYDLRGTPSGQCPECGFDQQSQVGKLQK